MANPRQSNEPGYNRSAGGGLLRGGLLLLVTVVVGAVLLQQTKESPNSPVAAPEASTTTTIALDPALGTTPTLDAGVTATIAPVLRAPALVKVLVVNGSGVNRAAARVRASMASTGYNLLQATDATASNLEDSVFYNPGFEGEARQIATLLGEIDPVSNIIAVTPGGILPIKAPVPTSDIIVFVGLKLQTKYKNQQLGTGTVSGTPVASSARASAARPTSTKKKKTISASTVTGRARGTKTTIKAGASATPDAAVQATPSAETPAATQPAARVPVVAQPSGL